MYVQDSNDSTEPLTGSEDAGFSLNPDDRRDAGLGDDGEAGGEGQNQDENFQQFDEDVANEIKSNLSGEEERKPGESGSSENTNMSNIDVEISFSLYNQDQQSLSVGLIFINDESMQVNSCSLKIQASSGQTNSQKPNIPGQHGASGCRFDNISLLSLGEPSRIDPWKITILGNNASGQSLVTLEKDVTSVADLSNLNKL